MIEYIQFDFPRIDFDRNLRIGIELEVSCLQCNGARECKKALTLLNLGRLPEDFVEGMACEGGCIAGPGTIVKPALALKLRNAAKTAKPAAK